MANTRAVGDQVKWQDIHDLAKRVDKLGQEKFCIPYSNGPGLDYAHTVTTEAYIRPFLYPSSTSRNQDNMVYLTKDETTPFGAEKLGHNGGEKRKFFIRFEFGYYNFKRDTEDQYVFAKVKNWENEDKRYYAESGDNSGRLPILHTHFLETEAMSDKALQWSDLMKKEQFTEEFKKQHLDPSHDFVWYMTEINMGNIYKWWPFSSKTHSVWRYTDGMDLEKESKGRCLYYKHLSKDFIGEKHGLFGRR